MSKDITDEKRFVLVSPEEHKAVKANDSLRDGLKEDKYKITKDALNEVQIQAKEGIKNEYALTANILEKAGNLYDEAKIELGKNYKGAKGAGQEGIEQYVMAHLEPYLNCLNAVVGDKGANKQIIQAFKDNISELTQKSRTLSNARGDEIKALKNMDIKTTTGWKVIADLLGNNKLGNFFKDLHEKSVQKDVNKLADKLVNKKLDLKGIAGTLKGAGMSPGKKDSHAPIRSQAKHEQDKTQGKSK